MEEQGTFRLILKSLGGLLFLPFWYFERLLPRDRHVWVFGSWFGKRYSDNSRAMYEYVLENCPDIKPVWITRDAGIYDRLKSQGRPVAMAQSREGRRICLKAGAAFITTSPLDMNEKYLNGAYMVWLWHGVGLKYIMADELRMFLWPKYSAFKKFKVKLNRFLFPWENKVRKDCLMNTGDFFTRFFCSGFELEPDKVWVDGYPRNDVLFNGKTQDIVREYREKFPTAKFIIYMPTHRINEHKGVPFNGFDGFGFDSTRFFDVLQKNDYVFFNKGHFYDSNADIRIENERFLNVNDSMYDDLYAFIKDMDILITDFSSVYFDFILLGRPVILAPFDYDEYVSKERPLQFDYNEQEGVQVHDWNELMDVLENRKYFDSSDENIAKFHKHRDGESCRRITQHLKRELDI
jgi:CDP-glycerol glycerophosphotransferase